MSAGFTPPPPDRGQLPSRRIALVALGWLLLMAAALGGTGWWEHRTRPEPQAPASPVMGRSEQANIDQRPFALTDDARRLGASQRQRLESYGWVDRDAGLIHVPVERAREQVLAGEGGHE